MEKTGIEWTDATVNFWTGCQKVSPGCKFCYMYRDKERWNKSGSDVVKVNRSTINGILRKLTTPSKIFTCSWSDFFTVEGDQWRNEAWDIIRSHPQHQWQILTKRPERISECLPPDWGQGWDNVWLGVSIESQEYIHRAVELLKIPAKTYFLSLEPLLGPINIHEYALLSNGWRNDSSRQNYIDWVIIGGESGHGSISEDPKVKYKYRKCEITWIQSIVDQCKSQHTPVFVKQFGTHLKHELNLKAKAGGDIEEWIQSLRVRQFPKLI